MSHSKSNHSEQPARPAFDPVIAGVEHDAVDRMNATPSVVDTLSREIVGGAA
jgi:hypothetical protein